MGCDIHLYIEYMERGRERTWWRDFGGRLNPGRNYFIFGVMSKGVRVNTEFSFEARGLPEDIGYSVLSDSRLYISDSGSDGTATMESALQWSKNGQYKIINDTEGKPTWVEHPDWHSHSWLTTSEFEEVMKYYNLKKPMVEPEYESVLAAMRKFEELGYDARIVFWFDN